MLLLDCQTWRNCKNHQKCFLHLFWKQNMYKLFYRILTEVKMNQHFPNFNGTSSLTVLRMDKSKLSSVSPDLCLFCPQLKSLWVFMLESDILFEELRNAFNIIIENIFIKWAEGKQTDKGSWFERVQRAQSFVSWSFPCKISFAENSHFFWFRDLGRNEITDLKSRDLEAGPFESLSLLHDLILHHNNISRIEKDSFSGLQSLQVL